MGNVRVGIVGSSGIVGRELLNILKERSFPISFLRLFASERTAGKTVSFCQKEIPIQMPSEKAFHDLDITFFMAGASVSRCWVPHAVKAGSLVVDNSSFYRMDDAVPLVLCGVNDQIVNKSNSQIYANPNCSTSVLLMALAPLHRAFGGLKHVAVATYQSVSGAGKDGMEALKKERKGSHHQKTPFAVPIDKNVIPHIDVFLDDGRTKEEWKMLMETRKILQIPSLPFEALCVRVPVVVGHAMVVFMETREPCPLSQVRKILREAPEIILQDNNGTYATPLKCGGKNETYVSRLCKSDPRRLSFFVVGDNLRKGAALNSVQIAEVLTKKGKQ